MAGAPSDLRPMLASLADASLQDPQLVYEPKYDGIRAIVEIRGRGSSSTDKEPRPRVRLWSRLGNEKTRQFPELAAALEKWSAARRTPLVLDGEIVALDAHGQPAGFQQLQGRLHLEHLGVATSAPSAHGVAFIAFDLLRDGSIDLRDRPLLERRTALERVFTGLPSLLRLSDIVHGDGRELYRRALDRGWEGVIAKRADSKYRSGKRTPDWRKLKIVREQEFVVGGWTEPRESRVYFGSLALGVYDSSHQPPATAHQPATSHPASAHRRCQRASARPAEAPEARRRQPRLGLRRTRGHRLRRARAGATDEAPEAARDEDVSVRRDAADE